MVLVFRHTQDDVIYVYVDSFDPIGVGQKKS